MNSKDSELTAMSSIVEFLEPLDDEARRRVLLWASDRFEVEIPPPEAARAQRGSTDQELPGADDFEDFAHLYDLAGPGSDDDRALLGAYWVSEVLGESPFPTQPVNEELKNLGHGIARINEVFDRLKSEQPALVRQVAKTGSTQQARKIYKITRAGIRRVDGLLEGSTD